MYTPSGDSLYLITVYQTVTSAGSAGTLASTIYWTDDWSSKSNSGAGSISLASLNTFSNGVNYIQAKAGTPIQFSTTLTGVLGNPQYSIYITIQKLS